MVKLDTTLDMTIWHNIWHEVWYTNWHDIGIAMVILNLTVRSNIFKKSCAISLQLFLLLIKTMELFLNGAELSLNSVNAGNVINNWSMDWAQFKDSVSHMCLAGTEVASWSLTQEVAGSSPFTVMANIFVTKFTEFSETFRKNSNTD